MKVFGENILDRYDILDPIPESKIFGRKGIPKGRGLYIRRELDVSSC